MLAGALFNRAADIFTTVVDLEAKGVHISPDNELMRQCGEFFGEALELGKTVKHYSGQRFPGRRIVPDPVAIEVDAGFGVDVLSSAVFYFS